MALPQWTVNELKTRYELEKDLDDVFVEGNFDKDVFERILSEKDLGFRPIYLIETVNVDEEILRKYNFSNGNKQKIIALSRELSLPRDTWVRLVVDKDLDHWLGDLETTNGLSWTLFCDTDVCFFDEKIINDLVCGLGKSRIADFSKFFCSMKNVLKKIYCLRMIVFEKHPSIGLIDITRCLFVGDSTIEIDLAEYVKRCLSHQIDHEKIKETYDCVLSKYESVKQNDHRLLCRGHDLFRVAAWSINNFKGDRTFADESALAKIAILLSPSLSKEILHPIILD